MEDLISIFIGSTTGVIVALEKGLKILHICFDPIFDSYSEFFWPNLKVKKLTNNSFIYSLKEKGTFIKFWEGKKTIDNFYNNFDKLQNYKIIILILQKIFLENEVLKVQDMIFFA